MGDKSEIIDVEYENGTKGGDVIDKGGTTQQYGATINISYSWDPASSFNYSSLAMTLNGNTYLPKTSSTYLATFSYSTDLSNVTSYNIIKTYFCTINLLEYFCNMTGFFHNCAFYFGHLKT